jgi:hypothetical protein
MRRLKLYTYVLGRPWVGDIRYAGIGTGKDACHLIPNHVGLLGICNGPGREVGQRAREG